MKKQRLDKILSHIGIGTRKEIKYLAKKGLVVVDGQVVKDTALQVDPETQEIIVNDIPVVYREFVYIMMNKPSGVISATIDHRETTVIDLLDVDLQVFEPFPVGRLDKDTEGLLLLTNDGKLSHNLLSPKKHVPKTYYAEIDGRVTEKDVADFKQGVVLEDGYKTLPSDLEIVSSDEESKVHITIYEGKFHQVKRMFLAVAKEVTYLKRLKMGSLELDQDLELGEYRELTEEELEALRNREVSS